MPRSGWSALHGVNPNLKKKKIGCKMKLGCQNLMYNLLNWNVHNTYNLCSEEHGEHSEQHLFDTKFQRIKG